MSKYTDEEIETFKKKDILNAKQSALKAASINNEGKQISTDKMISESAKYYDWLFNHMGSEAPSKSDCGDNKGKELPTPSNDKDEKLLQEIFHLYAEDVPEGYLFDCELIERKIIEKFGKWPTREESIPKILKAIPLSEVIVKKEK